MLARYLKSNINFSVINPYLQEAYRPNADHDYKTIKGHTCYGHPFLIIVEAPLHHLTDASAIIERRLVERMDELATTYRQSQSNSHTKQLLRELYQQLHALQAEYRSIPHCHITFALTYRSNELYCAGFTTHHMMMDLYNKESDISKPLAPKHRQLLKPKQIEPLLHVFCKKVHAYDIIFTHTQVDGTTRVIDELVMPSLVEEAHLMNSVLAERIQQAQQLKAIQPSLIQTILNKILQEIDQRRLQSTQIPLLARTLAIITQTLNDPDQINCERLMAAALEIDKTGALLLGLFKLFAITFSAAMIISGIVLFCSGMLLIPGLTLLISGLVLAGTAYIVDQYLEPQRLFGMRRQLMLLSDHADLIYNDMPKLDS